MPFTMSEVLKAFDALPPTEQQKVAAEILRRFAGEGELSNEALNEVAVELFRSYDAEETWAPVDAIYRRLVGSDRTFSDSADLLREDRDR